MRELLTKLFGPLLRLFESDQEPANFKSSHRTALNVLGILFLFLACVAVVTGYYAGSVMGAFIPVLAFCCVGSVALIIGSLGSNAAVAKIWGSK